MLKSLTANTYDYTFTLSYQGKVLEYFENSTRYDISGPCGYNLLSTIFKHIENFLQKKKKRVVKPNKRAKQLSLSERCEALILCREAIINVPFLCVQGITGDAVFNCNYVFTLVFCIIHSRRSFVFPKST